VLSEDLEPGRVTWQRAVRSPFPDEWRQRGAFRW
jgi:hypothetical protein